MALGDLWRSAGGPRRPGDAQNRAICMRRQRPPRAAGLSVPSGPVAPPPHAQPGAPWTASRWPRTPRGASSIYAGLTFPDSAFPDNFCGDLADLVDLADLGMDLVDLGMDLVDLVDLGRI